MSSVRRAAVLILALGLLGAAVLAGEAAYARSRNYLPPESAPALPAEYGAPGGPTLRLAVLGDSTAAGVGASSAAGSVAGALADDLAESTRRPVRLTALGVSGARAADLAGQVDRLLSAPDPAAGLVVVLVGANDATHATGLDSVRRDLETAVRRLRTSGRQVVVGTCPDLGAARALPRPLREVVAWRGRAVAEAEEEGVSAAGAVAVDLAALTGPAFRADPATLSSDRYHPSDAGYRLWAAALAPEVQAAVSRTG